VADSCIVLIASPDLLPQLKERAEDGTTEVLAFTDSEALRALEVITKRRPRLVTLERLFAATPRGAALIHRIKADPALVGSEIRVISHDSEYTRVLPRPADDGGDATATAPTGTTAATVAPAVAPPIAPVVAPVVVPVVVPAVVPAVAPPAAPVAPLDQRGTRRAPRFRIAAKVEIQVDGHPATLVDLSTVGAQVVSVGALKPNQRVRITMGDAKVSLRFNAAVAWAKFEIPPGSGPRYRAGLDFVDADHKSVDAFCTRYKQG
jgi:PilZ domain